MLDLSMCGLEVFFNGNGLREHLWRGSKCKADGDLAAFLGVDRNTIYDYAGCGTIPHQRLGKRILFRRGALVSWLDAL